MQTETNVPSHADLATELQGVLRDWAKNQAPAEDFSGWRMAAFLQPTQAPHRAVLRAGRAGAGRRAEEKAGEFASKLGLPAPLFVWSFDEKKELLVNPALVSFETEDDVEEEEIQAAA